MGKRKFVLAVLLVMGIVWANCPVFAQTLEEQAQIVECQWRKERLKFATMGREDGLRDNRSGLKSVINPATTNSLERTYLMAWDSGYRERLFDLKYGIKEELIDKK